MLLNKVEKAMMNNPIRRALQARFEVPRLLSMGGSLQGGRALEVGCGQGLGAALILERFGAEQVDGFDLDPQMVELATRRHQGDERVKLWVGDVEHVPAEDASYDAVFDFGIVHHVPDWRSALREIRRVLKPGGRFYAEEVLRAFIGHPIWARLLDHPQQDRFDAEQWLAALQETGFEVLHRRTLGPWFVWTVATAAT
jgi:ubiquinone/menaquinone biosynthesis C-methylase UbiE